MQEAENDHFTKNEDVSKNPIYVLHVDDDSSQIESSGQILMDMGNFEIGIYKASTIRAKLGGK